MTARLRGSNEDNRVEQLFVEPSAPEVIPAPPLELAVIIPTYNERENVLPLIESLKKALVETQWEAIFVDDDSPDGTSEAVQMVAARYARVHILKRIGRKGLASACIEGMLASAAPYLAVMDGDLQHDETILPTMLQRMKMKNLDVVVGSRCSAGGSMGAFSKERVWLSNLGKKISRAVCHCDVSDPMSGFFIVNRKYFDRVAPHLTGAGFKILVDILASSPGPVRLGEVGYQFRNRLRGESKLDANVEFEYLFLVLDKMIGRWVPTRFILFGLVGSVGIIAHLTLLWLLLLYGRADFAAAQTVATFVAMTMNFFLNNSITFRDRRLRGPRLALGYLTFCLACSLGVFINVSFARGLIEAHFPWYIAGLAGIAISSVWNYGINTVLTWRRVRPRRA
jgi:dolichol-phosphate mannosyltransferase